MVTSIAQPEPVPDTDEHLRRMLRILWPAPLQVTVSRFAPLASTRGLLILPNAGQPKLILPRRPLVATAAAIRNYNTFATGRPLWMLRVVSAAARIGIFDALPDRVVIAGHGEGVDDHLSRVLGRDLVVAMYVGPKRAVQKPVLQLLSPAGETFAFAKVGMNPLTEELVKHEYEALVNLDAAQFTTLGVPKVLMYGEWQGHKVLVQEAAPASRDGAHIRLLLPAATRELAAMNGVSEQPWMESSYRLRMLRRLERLRRVSHSGLLGRVLAGVDDRLGHGTVRFGSWHGDWAPWNMTSVGDRLVAWDWETFGDDVPFGLDAAHHDIASRAVIAGMTPADAFADLLTTPRGSLTEAVVGPEATSLAVMLYLLEIVARYLEHGEVGAAGTPMSRLTEWVPRASESCERALVGATS